MATKLQIARARARVSLAELSGKKLPTEVTETAKLDFLDAEDMTRGPAAPSSRSQPGIDVPAVWTPLTMTDPSAATVHDMSEDIVDDVDDLRTSDPHIHAWISTLGGRYASDLTPDIEHQLRAGEHAVRLMIDLKGMSAINDDREAGTPRRIRSERSSGI